MKPVIGITSYPRVVETALGPTLLHTASRFYVESVERAGGIPVVLPVIEPSGCQEVLTAVEGVLMTGGGDVVVDRDRLDGVVTAQVVRHLRGEKLRVFTYKPKRGYKKMKGHRSELSQISIERVGGSDGA